MTARRWAVWAAVAAALAAAATLAVERWAETRIARALARRTAATTAAYLAIVTPPVQRGSADYDVAQLLVQTRALRTLPGWTAEVEVYHGTAPLGEATALPLPAVELARLRRREAAPWRGGAALVPLKDRDGRAVVGAVAVRAGVEDGGLGWLLGWALPAVFVTATAAGIVSLRRRPLGVYAAAAGLVGVIAAANVRLAARAATDRWLGDTRLLLQEAATRLPAPRARVGLAALAPLAREGGGAELVPADSAGSAPRRVRIAGAPRAAATVRLGAGRWVELRTLPGEILTTGWLALALGCALLGPLALVVLRWAEWRATRRQLRETATAWAFLAPATLHLAVFSLGPILGVLYLSVHRVGLANFGAALRDPLVWISLRNTVLYALYVPVSMAIALAVALVLRHDGRLARALRTAFVLPYVSSVVAVALVWQWLYHADFGLLNYALSLAGLGPTDWLGSPGTALIAVMLLSLWVQVGYQMVVFLAGLRAIPQAYLDAARADGANAWQRFWRVTFPLLRPVTLFVLVTGVIGSFQVFTYVYVLTGGGPLHATDVVVHRIYRTAWEFQQFGHAGALSLLLFLLLFGVTWVQFKLLGRRVEYA